MRDADNDDRDLFAGPVPVDLVTRPVDEPTSLGATDTVVLTSTDTVRLFNYEPTRAHIHLFPVGGVVIIGRDQGSVAQGYGCRIPANPGIPVTFHFRDELWARAETADVALSYLTDHWPRP